MAFELSDFRSALNFGGARPSLFEFFITSAPVQAAEDANIQMYCNVSELPPLTLTPIERQYMGRTVKIPGDLVFADLTTTIINTVSYNVRNGIEQWMEIINSTKDNVNVLAQSFGGLSTLGDFGQGEASLIHYQQGGPKTMTYKFVDIWPTNISEIALSYDTASDIEQFDVTWAYNYYTLQGGTVASNNVQG